MFKLAGSTVRWFSKKQKTVFTSTTEAKYTLSAATIETLWIQHLLDEMGAPAALPTVIYEDNHPALAIATNQKNPVFAKHIDFKYQAVGDYHQKGFITVTGISSKEQLADGRTTVLTDTSHLDQILGTLPSLESG